MYFAGKFLYLIVLPSNQLAINLNFRLLAIFHTELLNNYSKLNMFALFNWFVYLSTSNHYA